MPEVGRALGDAQKLWAKTLEPYSMLLVQTNDITFSEGHFTVFTLSRAGTHVPTPWHELETYPLGARVMLKCLKKFKEP